MASNTIGTSFVDANDFLGGATEKDDFQGSSAFDEPVGAPPFGRGETSPFGGSDGTFLDSGRNEASPFGGSDGASSFLERNDASSFTGQGGTSDSLFGNPMSTDVAQLSLPKLFDFMKSDELQVGEFTQEDLDGLTSTQKSRIGTITQETPTFLYHGFTDDVVPGDAEHAHVDPQDDVPRIDRRGFDVDITDFENNLRHVLDEGGNLVTTRDIVRSVLDETYSLPPNPHVIRIDDGDQTTALAVDVARHLDREYPEQSVKLELGINAGSVGSPGTDERYADPRYALERDETGEGYADERYDTATTPLTINDRKVTWEELGDWVREDLVELSNHGDTHLLQASRQTIYDDGIKLGGNTVSELDEEQVRAEILDGESGLEKHISEELGQDYQVSTFIWPGGHFDNPASVETFRSSGHVLGLGTEPQSDSWIPGQTTSPDPDNPDDTFPGLYDGVIDGIAPADPDLPLHAMPTISVKTSSDGRDGDPDPE